MHSVQDGSRERGDSMPPMVTRTSSENAIVAANRTLERASTACASTFAGTTKQEPIPTSLLPVAPAKAPDAVLEAKIAALDLEVCFARLNIS